jgi:HEAT repeat protein
MIAAYERFFEDPATSDPRCLAKTAIAIALRELGHTHPATYLRGISHVQLEPGWREQIDTAAELRGTCALALVDTQLADLEILAHLVDALCDAEKVVRIDAARAIEQLNRQEGALLLRLKLLHGDGDPDVLSQCFGSYLSLTPEGAVSFVARFLHSDSEDVQLEAASALAQSRDPRAIEILTESWRERHLSAELRRAVLINLGASTLARAAEFLLNVVASESIDLAKTALLALANSRFCNELRPRILDCLQQRDSSELIRLFEEALIRR